METCPKDITLSNSNNVPCLLIGTDIDTLTGQFGRSPRERCQNLHAGSHSFPSQLILRLSRRRRDSVITIALGIIRSSQYLLDYGCTNKNSRKGRSRLRGIGSQKGQVEQRLEALRLTTEMVPVHAHIKTPDKLLAPFLRPIRRLC